MKPEVVLFGTLLMLGYGALIGKTADLVFSDDTYCDVLKPGANQAQPGDNIILKTGTYTRCRIQVGGTPSQPITIKSEITSPVAQRATIFYSGAANSNNIFDIEVSNVVFDSLNIRDAALGNDVFKIISNVNNIVVKNNILTNIMSGTIRATQGPNDNIQVLNNQITNSGSTALYFGCADGSCSVTRALVEGNLISQVTAGTGEIGYALEIKLNSYGTVRDNTIYNTKGPCVQIFGSTNRNSPFSIVEGNFISGSLNNEPISLGGGPAIVRNNVVMGGTGGGIYSQNYQGRDIQYEIYIYFNTILFNPGGGIITQDWIPANNTYVAYNAIAVSSGPIISPPSVTATLNVGNIDCSTTAGDCWIDPKTSETSTNYNLLPTSTLQHLTKGESFLQDLKDFMCVSRPNVNATAGAFEPELSAVILPGTPDPRPAGSCNTTAPPLGTTGGGITTSSEASRFMMMPRYFASLFW